jgi:hypothetical protein
MTGVNHPRPTGVNHLSLRLVSITFSCVTSPRLVSITFLRYLSPLGVNHLFALLLSAWCQSPFLLPLSAWCQSPPPDRCQSPFSPLGVNHLFLRYSPLGVNHLFALPLSAWCQSLFCVTSLRLVSITFLLRYLSPLGVRHPSYRCQSPFLALSSLRLVSITFSLTLLRYLSPLGVNHPSNHPSYLLRRVLLLPHADGVLETLK